ncbi:hypothetical protein DXV76_12560 [Rhodobacteraceae bacterium CCMM004]|nr:hypothetical protein DXV76_12560 [Rhodobacteraceae bacterium CCMM004]
MGRGAVKPPASYAALERLGRMRLSRHFYVRNFLNSEIGNLYGIPNLPDDPDLMIAAGRRLAEDLLEPLVETFGPIEIRSGYRSPRVNAFGNARGHACAANDRNWANHIWDRRDAEGRMGACVSVVIPWFADRYAAGEDWRVLAQWLHDHLPFHEVWVFPINAALNLTWREAPERRVFSYVAPRGRWRPDPDAPLCHGHFPPFRGIAYP